MPTRLVSGASEDVEKVLGDKPTSFAQFRADHGSALEVREKLAS